MSDEGRMLADYFQLMNANGAARVYREALRSGLFDALRDSEKTAAETAQACGLRERPTELTLDVLEAMGLVGSAGDKNAARRYGLTPLAAMLLGGDYRELGDRFWAHLPALLEPGRPIARMDAPDESEAHYASQAAALAWMLGPAAQFAARTLAADGRLQRGAILDVGAGSAIWSLSIARLEPEATITAVDWPAVLEVARATAKRMGVDNRLTTLAGNYHEVNLPSATFDLAIVANVTHLESHDGNAALFAKIHSALKPNGRIAIVDVFPGQEQGDLNRALYSLGLALRTERGHVYKPEELEILLSAAGFRSASFCNLETPPYAVGMLLSVKG